MLEVPFESAQIGVRWHERYFEDRGKGFIELAFLKCGDKTQMPLARPLGYKTGYPEIHHADSAIRQ